MADKQDNITLPHSIDAEKAVLGALLRDVGAVNAVAERLRPKHFFMDAHGRIYEAMLTLYGANEPTDILTVADKLRQGQESADHPALSPAYLVELTENCPVTQNVEYYSEIVQRYYYLRRIIYSCQDTVKKATICDGTIGSFIEELEKEFLSIARDFDRKGLIPAHEVLPPTLDELEKRLTADGSVTGVPSGFTDLDNITGGWQKSDLIILAARPAMGKTALALNWAMNAAKKSFPVAIFTLEMSSNQLMMRLLSAEARVDSSRLRKGSLTEDEQDRLMYGAKVIHGLPSILAIDETPAIGLIELRSRCRRFKKEHGLELVIVDYLQLMGSTMDKRLENREREISEISMGLKALAKELNIPVIALAQLNRGPEKRTDKRPNLSDLRESGALEQTADIILFVYRDEYYNPSSEHVGKAEVIIGKNRHGATDKVFLAFQPNFVSFHNLAKEG